jgi:hypothetical protein
LSKLLNLGQCADRNLEVEVLCTGCYRRKTVPAKVLAARFDRELFPPNLNGRLKCAMCSSTRCEVTAKHTAKQ